MKFWLFITTFLFLIIGCKPAKEQKENRKLEGEYQEGGTLVADTVINTILQQIPSPLEMSALIKQTGSRYDKNILNIPSSYSRYINSYEQALNLGVFGTDLGYSNLYEENQQCILYIGAIKELADELRIDQFFNFKLIQRLADERNLDSLLLISTQSYNQVNGFFQEQQRPGLSILLLVGGWMEAMNISCQVGSMTAVKKPIYEKIGEQKIVLESIIKLMQYFKDSDENFTRLNRELTELGAIYESVKINRTYATPTYTEKNGVVETKDNSTSTVDLDDHTFILIKTKVQEIRSEIVS